mgnify:FL=1
MKLNVAVLLSVVKEDKMTKAVEWVKSRVSEPSTWAAVGASVVGLGVLTNIFTLVLIGVVLGVLGFVLKEKGVL